MEYTLSSVTGDVLTYCLLLVGILRVSSAGAEATPAVPWSDGETLRYDVRWSVVDLASLTFRAERATNRSGVPLHRLRLWADSVVPWVDRHVRADTLCDDTMTARYFRWEEYDDDTFASGTYHFDYDNEVMLACRLTNDRGIPQDIDRYSRHDLREPIGNLCTALYFLRSRLRDGRDSPDLNVRVFNDFKLYDVLVRVRGIEEIEIGRPRVSCRVRKIEAVFPPDGVAGMNGEVEAWFSADERCRLVAAKMKVFIGSVRITLVGEEKAALPAPPAPDLPVRSPPTPR